MIKLYICCLVLIIGSVEVGPDMDMKFHQEVMEIVSYDIMMKILVFQVLFKSGETFGRITIFNYRTIIDDDISIEAWFGRSLRRRVCGNSTLTLETTIH